VAATLSTPLAVIVKNKAGEPLGGIAVTFQVASGGGTLSVPGVSTDASGRATTAWILGQRSGVQQATATVGNLPPVNFVAVAAAAAPASIVKVAGDAQTAVVGAPLTTRASVSVKDQFGNAVADAPVTFTVTTGGGSAATSPARTDVSGTASVAWTMGTQAGAQTLSAAAGAATPVSFTATATPDVPASVRFTPADPIVLGVGYSQQISAAAVDRFGNVTTTPVTLSIAAGGGFFTLSAGVVAGTARGSGSVVAVAGAISASQAVSIVDPWSRASVIARPFGVAVSGTAVFTTQLDASTVSRLQLPFGAVTGISVGTTPTDVAANAAGTIALVSNQSDGTVGVIDLGTNQQTRTIGAGGSTFRVITSADGTRGYATQAGGKLVVIDLATGTSLGSITIPPTANGLAMGAGDTLVYVSSMGGNIAVVNVRQNVVTQTFTVPGTLQDLAISSDGSTLYVAHEDTPRIDVVSIATGAVTSQITTPSVAFGLKLAPDGRTLYVTHPSSGRVSAIDRLTGVLIRSFAVGGSPRRISFDRATGRAVVANEAGWLDYLFLP
jgi:YVTN family beta-propeller protein